MHSSVDSSHTLAARHQGTNIGLSARRPGDLVGSSVSSAFFAMKALPIVAAIAAFLGASAGVCLLGCFGAMAEDLGLADTVARAADTRTLLYVTGAIAGVLQLAATKLPVALLLIGALVVPPLAIGVLVQFLRVMLVVRREIGARLSS
jgi:hypothetical protein